MLKLSHLANNKIACQHKVRDNKKGVKYEIIQQQKNLKYVLYLIDVFINKDPIENIHTRTTYTLLYRFTSFKSSLSAWKKRYTHILKLIKKCQAQDTSFR